MGQGGPTTNQPKGVFFVRKCLICGAEYEMPKSRRMACKSCSDAVRDCRQYRFLTIEQRLWGRCYLNGDCWDYGEEKSDGRPRSIMADGRQVPPAHVALWLSGKPRPSPLHSTRRTCSSGNPLCVNPAHLEWAEEAKARGPMWAHMMTPDQLAHYHELKRAKKTQYQRNWRRKVSETGASSVREAKERRAMERVRVATQEAALSGPTVLMPLPSAPPGTPPLDYSKPRPPRAPFVPLVVATEPEPVKPDAHLPWRDDPWVDEPEAPALSPEPSEPVSEPVAKPSALLTLLSGAKIAPVD